MKKTVLIIITIACVLLSLAWIFDDRITGFLTESNRTDANLMIIDGWMRLTTVDSLKEEIQKNKYDQIIVAGIRSSDLDFCKVEMNGFLIFYPRFKNLPDQDIKEHTLEIVTKSKMGGIYKCHYFFHVNDSIIGEHYSEGFENTACFNWRGSLNDIDSMMVQFTNDMYDDYGDRDLFIKEIRIDTTIIIPYQYNSVTDFGRMGGTGRKVNDYDSHPQIIRNKIFDYGVDSSKVTAITIDKTILNRTLAIALAVRNFIEKDDTVIQDIKGINVVSMGIHSKRTWRTYRNVLNKSIEIGYISLPDYRDSDPKLKRILRTITETIDYLYYCVILVPYRIGLF